MIWNFYKLSNIDNDWYACCRNKSSGKTVWLLRVKKIIHVRIYANYYSIINLHDGKRLALVISTNNKKLKLKITVYLFTLHGLSIIYFYLARWLQVIRKFGETINVEDTYSLL